MADPNFSWIYLVIFLAIPLARIIPRLLAKYRGEQPSSDQFERRFDGFGQPESNLSFTKKEPEKPLTRERQVLRELHQGVNSFDNHQKNTGFDTPMLNSILEDLEKQGLMKVVEKQGMFGPKVELYSTDKGFKDYYS